MTMLSSSDTPTSVLAARSAHPSLPGLSLNGVGWALVGLSSSVQLPQLRLLLCSLIRSNAARYFCRASLALSRMVSPDSTDAVFGDPGCALPASLPWPFAASSVLDTDARPLLGAASAAALEAPASDRGRCVLSRVLGKLPAKGDCERSLLSGPGVQLKGLALAPLLCPVPASDPGRLPGIERCMLRLARLVGLAGKPWELPGRVLILRTRTANINIQRDCTACYKHTD